MEKAKTQNEDYNTQIEMLKTEHKLEMQIINLKVEIVEKMNQMELRLVNHIAESEKKLSEKLGSKGNLILGIISLGFVILGTIPYLTGHK